MAGGSLLSFPAFVFPPSAKGHGPPPPAREQEWAGLIKWGIKFVLGKDTAPGAEGGGSSGKPQYCLVATCSAAWGSAGGSSALCRARCCAWQHHGACRAVWCWMQNWPGLGVKARGGEQGTACAPGNGVCCPGSLPRGSGGRVGAGQRPWHALGWMNPSAEKLGVACPRS